MKLSLLLLFLSVFTSAAFAECQTVQLGADEIPPGYIVISRKESKLYYGFADGMALRCPVAIPANSPAKKWLGWNYVERKAEWPAWQAPDLVSAAHPELAGRTIPGGAPDNPMGAAAMVLKYHESAIHGTTDKMRASIGTAASFGCIRMYNEDVTNLYQYVQKGDNVCMGTDRNDALRRCREALEPQSARFIGDKAAFR